MVDINRIPTPDPTQNQPNNQLPVGNPPKNQAPRVAVRKTHTSDTVSAMLKTLSLPLRRRLSMFLIYHFRLLLVFSFSLPFLGPKLPSSLSFILLQ